MGYQGKKILTYRLDFALSNKYLEVIILCLVPKILNEKVEVLFCKIKKTNIPSICSLNILCTIHSSTTFKY